MKNNIEEKLLENTNIPRIVLLIGEINTENVMKAILKIQELDSISNDKIILEINSPGGSVDDGLALIDIMQSAKSPIYTVALGQASSMASLILAAGEKGHRKANKHCRILLHQLQTGYMGKFNDVSEMYHSTLKMNDIIYNLYAEFTGNNANNIKDKLQNDYILSGEDAVEYGLIDSII